MKKNLLIICAILFLIPWVSHAQKPSERSALFNSWHNYEVSTVQVGTSGTKYLKVWGFGRKVDRAIVQAKKNAVHACLFRGIPGNSTSEPTPAIITDPNVLNNNLDYFYDFFETASDYLQFVNLTTDGVPSGQDKREVKGGYKVAIYVQVMYDNLRKKMEADGIIKKLDDGFSSSDGNAAVKPIIMVVPSDRWCHDNGFVLKFDNDGKTEFISDYARAFAENGDIRSIVSELASFMQSNNFPIVSLEEKIKGLKEESAVNMLLESKDDGSSVAESPMDVLMSAAKPDILLEIDYEIVEEGFSSFVRFNLNTVDSYSKKIISGHTGQGTPSTSYQLTNQLKEAVYSFKDEFLHDMMNYFSQLFINGREIKVTVLKWEGCDIDFEEEYALKEGAEEEELGDLIKRHIRRISFHQQPSSNTVATANKLCFEQVHIPMLPEKLESGEFGDTPDAKWFGNKIRKFIKKTTGQTCKVQAHGLGNVTVIMGSK